MRKCDSCGKLYQESKDVFCPHCGAVAQKQCTHGSSFDSKKYDRGEIYKSNNTQYQNTTYNKGFEPHAQREQPPYNQTRNTFDDKFPKINLPDLTKTFSEGKNKHKIGVIVAACIILLNLFVANLASFDDMNDDYSDNAFASEVYEDKTEFYPVSNSASIEPVADENGYKGFALIIENIIFPSEEVEQSTEIKDYIINGKMFMESQLCSFSDTEVPEIVYNIAVDESYCVSAKYGEEAGHYIFDYDFDCGEIIHFFGGVSMYLDDGTYVNVELPFGAFSVSETGEVIYYTSYADESTEWSTIFTECSNKFEDFDVNIVF